MDSPVNSEDIYERLANALEALPSGFLKTKSGVEMHLIKKAFTPEEVWLAGQLSRTPETAAEIAKRVGLDEAKVTETLESLVPRRLVRLDTLELQVPGVRPKSDGVTKYRLGPFLVGWYEAMMRGPMVNDKEFAELFEQFIIEGGGERIFAPRPGVLGVIPHRGSLRPELIQPYEDIDAHFQRHERFLVIDCVCRTEQNLLGSKCEKPIQRCGFVGMPPQTPLSKNILDREQASKLLGELAQMGHVQLGFYGFTAGSETPQFVGTCNCCGCCCGVLRGVTHLGLAEAPQRSNYRAVKDPEKCLSCGVCVERCQVHAIRETDDKPLVDREKCIGCGACVIACPNDALEMVPVSAEEWFHYPTSFTDWEERRLQNFGTPDGHRMGG